MGHIINPISTRLGLNLFWNSNWSLNNKFNYPKMSKQNAFFFNFLDWILTSKKWKKKNIIFSHYSIYINNNNKLYINIFFYWPFFEKNLSTKQQRFRFIKNNKKIIKKHNLIFQKFVCSFILIFFKKHLNKVFKDIHLFL